MASGLIHIMFGSLLYGTVTFGRLLVVCIMIVMSLIGVNAEERELSRIGGPQYRLFMREVPSKLIPDYRLLFYTEDQINAKRNIINPAYYNQPVERPRPPKID